VSASVSNAYIHARCPIKLLVIIEELGSQRYEHGLIQMNVRVCVCVRVCVREHVMVNM
jgi:hypothetical protein